MIVRADAISCERHLLIDTGTVISLHEDPGPVHNEKHVQSMRGNTLSVLSQLSKFGHLSEDPTSMQTVRQALDAVQTNSGIEGASNLFYHLFDDWRAVYSTIATFRRRLEGLVCTLISLLKTLYVDLNDSKNKFLKIW